MKLTTLTRLAAVAAGIAAAAGGFVACNSSDANPTPVVPFDSGIPNNPDVYVPPTGDSSPGPQPEASTIDANLPDVGNCVSDAATCNSCYTPAQDPLNGCSPATVNCVPFDNTRVPPGAP